MRELWPIRASSMLRLAGPLLLGIVSSALLKEAWKHRNYVVATLPVSGTVLAIAVSGVVLYMVRGRFRLFYGVNETLVGLYASYIIFLPGYTTLGTAEWLQVAAGLYIIVRGLDNVGKGLEHTSFKSTWQRVSGESA